MKESEDKRDMARECFACEHLRSIPGDCHISCAKPDNQMTGLEYGIRKGWFFLSGYL